MDIDIELLVNKIPATPCRCSLATKGVVHITGSDVIRALGRHFLTDADMIEARITEPAKRAVTQSGTSAPL